MKFSSPLPPLEHSPSRLFQQLNVSSKFSREGATEGLERWQSIKPLRARAPVNDLPLEVLDNDRLFVAQQKLGLFARVVFGSFAQRVVGDGAVNFLQAARDDQRAGINHHMARGSILATKAGLLPRQFSQKLDVAFEELEIDRIH